MHPENVGWESIVNIAEPVPLHGGHSTKQRCVTPSQRLRPKPAAPHCARSRLVQQAIVGKNDFVRPLVLAYAENISQSDELRPLQQHHRIFGPLPPTSLSTMFAASIMRYPTPTQTTDQHLTHRKYSDPFTCRRGDQGRIITEEPNG
jgi:hypothetical protein